MMLIESWQQIKEGIAQIAMEANNMFHSKYTIMSHVCTAFCDT